MDGHGCNCHCQWQDRGGESATVMHEALNLLLEGQSLNYLSKLIPKYRCKVAKWKKRRKKNWWGVGRRDSDSHTQYSRCIKIASSRSVNSCPSQTNFSVFRMQCEIELTKEFTVGIANLYCCHSHHVEQKTVWNQSHTQNCWIFQRKVISSSSFVTTVHSVVDRDGFKLW